MGGVWHSWVVFLDFDEIAHLLVKDALALNVENQREASSAAFFTRNTLFDVMKGNKDVGKIEGDK